MHLPDSTPHTRRVAVVGATGFVGTATVASLVAAGHTVHAFTRRSPEAGRLRSLGARPVIMDADPVARWTDDLVDSEVVIDLAQPSLPDRLTVRSAIAVSAQRITLTRTMATAIRRVTPDHRPLLLSVSGADDLQPDGTGVLRGGAPLRTTPRGFGHIGMAVRREVESTGLEAAFVYLGNIVVGTGKAFRDRLVPGVAAGTVKVIGGGDNLLPVTHIQDAAAALTHLVGLDRSDVAGRGFLVAPDSIMQRAFLAEIASAVGAREPGRIPFWIASAAIGRVQAEVMTLHARADASTLTRTGFRFRYPEAAAAVRAALAAPVAA